MDADTDRPLAAVERLVEAVNDHDLERLVSCFAEDYINDTPVHPQRAFRGRHQVRKNWTQIFAGVADVRARVPRRAAIGNIVWSEWELSGTRADGAAFLLRGVVIFETAGDTITAARFYLEPVEETGTDINAHTRHLAGTSAGPDDRQRQ